MIAKEKVRYRPKQFYVPADLRPLGKHADLIIGSMRAEFAKRMGRR